MTRWDFDLIVEGRDLMDEDAFNALHHASESTNDDVHPGWRSGVQYAGFMRDAGCLEEAVLTGVQQVESVGGVKVVGVVDTSFVTLSQIAERSGHSQQNVEALIAGTAGPGGFPSGLTAFDGDCTEWPWDEVAEWFRRALGELIDDPNADVYEMLALAARERCGNIAPQYRRLLGELFAAGDPIEQPIRSRIERGLVCDECAPDDAAAAD